MTLARKPRVGERVVDSRGDEYEVTGFRDRFPDICTIRGAECELEFIWTFRDGLNKEFSIVPTPGTCRVCCCTDDAACEGGCSWADVEHTLCTGCA